MTKWAAVILPAWLALVLCAHWEPVVRDGWGHVHWHRTTELSLGNVWEFATGSYLHNNPRLGQVFTLLLYTPGPWHALITPVVELGMFVLLTSLVLGRWPSLRSADDARLFTGVTAIGLATCPAVGPMLCYRPYTGNYLYGLVVALVFALPYRFHLASPRRLGWWAAPVMMVIGFAAGLCNEHTGVAIVAATVCALVVFLRRGERIAPWMIAGLVGLVVGHVALLLAPGQSIRYDALATRHTTLEVIAERGIIGNARLVGGLALHLAAAVPWLAIALIARRRAPVAVPRSLYVIAGAGLLATLALYASPLVGDRLYAASTLVISAAIAGWVHAQATARRARSACALVSIAVLCVVATRCLLCYHELGARGAERIAALADAAPGSEIVLEPFGVETSHWSVGEDLHDTARRAIVAHDYGLARVELAPD